MQKSNDTIGNRTRDLLACSAVQNLSDSKDINRAWENIKENIKTTAKESLGLQELKQHYPWFDEKCLAFLDHRKQAKMLKCYFLKRFNG